MSSSRGSSDFILATLRNPHDRDERAESRIFSDDDSHRPLIGTPTRDHTMGVDDLGNKFNGAGSRGNGNRNGGGGFQTPPPRRWSSGKVRRSAGLFERPKWGHLCLHVFLCIAGYPILYIGAIFARDKSLFWARVIVGLWCAAVGVVIGWSLLAYASRFLEAASGFRSLFLHRSGHVVP